MVVKNPNNNSKIKILGIPTDYKVVQIVPEQSRCLTNYHVEADVKMLKMVMQLCSLLKQSSILNQI